MYTEHDPLAELKEITGAPKLPPRGDLDLQQVLGSFYFAA
jgi:DNA-directed RNA polymerase